eukprot:scaffold7334_cov64-Phaeocystis_antarctica.AAC.5
MLSIPKTVSRTTAVAHTTRIARASVGKRARRRRQTPSEDGTSHQKRLPTAAPIGWPVKPITVGVRLIADNANPACPIAKLTRSRRPAADARAACSTPLTAAELRAAPVTDSETDVAAPWTPTLGSAFTPMRSRRQPARPRSSRVGRMETAMAAAKAVPTRILSSRSLYPRVASIASRSSANAAEALLRAHRQESSASLHGTESKRTPPSHARARHCPVPGSTHAQSCW